MAAGEATLRRALAGVDGDEWDIDELGIAVSAGISQHTGSTDPGAGTWAAVAVDGKTLRGTVGRDGGRDGGAGVHLLAALTHQQGTVAGQRLVPIGSSEIAEVEPLLDGIDLTGKAVTADALHTTLHTTHAHATYLHQRRRAPGVRRQEEPAPSPRPAHRIALARR